MKKILLTLTALALAFTGSTSLQAQKTEKLFNGKDLSNWNLVVNKNEVPGEKVFSVKEGMIRIEGQPFGYMYTKEEYDNYKLHVEWRWPEGKASNSGIFLLVGDKDMPFPNCNTRTHLRIPPENGTKRISSCVTGSLPSISMAYFRTSGPAW